MINKDSPRAFEKGLKTENKNNYTVFTNTLSNLDGAKFFIIETLDYCGGPMPGRGNKRPIAYSYFENAQTKRTFHEALKAVIDSPFSGSAIGTLKSVLDNLLHNEWAIMILDMRDHPDLYPSVLAHALNEPGETRVAVLTPEMQYTDVDVNNAQIKLRNYPPVQRVTEFRQEYKKLYHKFKEDLIAFYDPKDERDLLSDTAGLVLATSETGDIISAIDTFLIKLSEKEKHVSTGIDERERDLKYLAALVEIFIEVNALGSRWKL